MAIGTPDCLACSRARNRGQPSPPAPDPFNCTVLRKGPRVFIYFLLAQQQSRNLGRYALYAVYRVPPVCNVNLGNPRGTSAFMATTFLTLPNAYPPLPMRRSQDQSVSATYQFLLLPFHATPHAKYTALHCTTHCTTLHRIHAASPLS